MGRRHFRNGIFGYAEERLGILAMFKLSLTIYEHRRCLPYFQEMLKYNVVNSNQPVVIHSVRDIFNPITGLTSYISCPCIPFPCEPKLKHFIP